LVEAGCGWAQPPPPEGVTVFAASPTAEALTKAAAQFELASGKKITCRFDASSVLAKQIKGGAAADIFLSTDEQWMNDLEAAGFIDPSTRRDLLGNQLAIIGPRGAQFYVAMDGPFDFAVRLPHLQRIAIGNPDNVPVGRHARQALEYMGWWEDVKGLVIPLQNEQSVLRMVERKEVDAGIIYLTDAIASKDTKTIAIFPAVSHPPIRYPIALCRKASPDARAFLDFLQTRQIQTMFTEHGFKVLN
jgi:molybdate transport system substrate-binding protein